MDIALLFLFYLLLVIYLREPAVRAATVVLANARYAIGIDSRPAERGNYFDRQTGLCLYWIPKTNPGELLDLRATSMHQLERLEVNHCFRLERDHEEVGPGVYRFKRSLPELFSPSPGTETSPSPAVPTMTLSGATVTIRRPDGALVVTNVDGTYPVGHKLILREGSGSVELPPIVDCQLQSASIKTVDCPLDKIEGRQP